MYDYIVVGTGPAGATIAKTLSDDRRNSVLLLEAGENNNQDLPIRDSAFAYVILINQFFPQYFWQGEGVPQKDVNNRVFNWTGGRLLGGGSAVNYEQYVRPTPEVMIRWEQLLGPLWSPYEATLRFKELETYWGMTNNPMIHGYKGSLNIRQAPAEPTTMTQKLTLAIEQATGLEEILDYNDPYTPMGPFTRNQYTQKPDGQRDSAGTAFLSPQVVNEEGYGVDGRKLRLLTKSTALSIIFDNKRAAGIKFLQEGNYQEAFATKKVIISAGIKSTKLLMVSGIGPRDQLMKAKIPVVLDNPNVGDHLSNHAIVPAVFTTNENDNPIPAADPNARMVGGAFLPSPMFGADPRRRDIQIISFSGRNTLTLGACLVQPKSRGTIKIQADDPLKIELGNEGFLNNPADMALLKSTFQIYIKTIAKRLNAIDPEYKLISPTEDIINDDIALENFIKERLGLMYHEQGALRMAPSAETGVVNQCGEVFGVRDLIVADNSIIPFIVDGNPVAAAYLIGLTIAQQLLKR